MDDQTKTELLVLNCLIYTDRLAAGGNVAEWAASLASDPTAMNAMFAATGTMAEMTRPEFEQILNEIAQDPAYQQMTIKDVSIQPADPRGDGHQLNAMATFELDGQPIILFKGTSGPLDWHDNGVGGYAGVADTERQQQGLAYYNQQMSQYPAGTQAIVTGHSKGGNIAQYVTVVAGASVAACVSFDGQGFSEPFYDKYAAGVTAYGGKITNISNSSDFVNILLDPVPGSTQWYTGDGVLRAENRDELKHAFFRFHTPYTIFTPDNGRLTIGAVADQPGAVMGGVDDFVAFAQRYMSRDDFMFLASTLMTVPEANAALYGPTYAPPGGTTEFVKRLLMLVRNYCETHGVSSGDLATSLAALLGGTQLRIRGLPLAALVAALYPFTPSTGYSAVTREFTQEVKVQLLQLAQDVEAHGFLQQVGDFFSDPFERYRHWVQGVGLPADAAARESYYRSLADMNNTSAEQIRQIWEDVGAADAEFAGTIKGYTGRLATLRTQIVALLDRIHVG